jgi:hypothetical protein
MAVFLVDAVFKTVDLLCFQHTVFPPAQNVPPGGRADIHSKITLHRLPFLLCARSVKHRTPSFDPKSFLPSYTGEL